MGSNFGILNEIQMSAVHEVANIGLGNAMVALSNLTGRSYAIEVPHVEQVVSDSIAATIGGPEELCVATYMPIAGDIGGYVAFIFPWSATQRLTELLVGTRPESTEDITELEVSVLSEIGNILNSSFMNALSEMTGLAIHATPPIVGAEMITSLLDTILAEAEMTDTVALTLETALREEGTSTSGFFVFIPNAEGLHKVLDRLGFGEAA